MENLFALVISGSLRLSAALMAFNLLETVQSNPDGNNEPLTNPELIFYYYGRVLGIAFIGPAYDFIL
jgi:hypothetical protein